MNRLDTMERDSLVDDLNFQSNSCRYNYEIKNLQLTLTYKIYQDVRINLSALRRELETKEYFSGKQQRMLLRLHIPPLQRPMEILRLR